MLLAGLVFACMGIKWLDRTDSPFLKIIGDATDLFAADKRLWLIPLFLVLVCACLALWPLGCLALLALIEDLVVFTTIDTIRLPHHLLISLSACLIGSCVIGGMFFSSLDSVIVESFIEENLQEPFGFWRSVGRVILRLPSLLIFGALWSFILAIGTLLRMTLERWVRFNIGWTAASMIAIAGWALELGWTMASYFVLVMVLREKMGPFEGVRRAAQLARAEFGMTLGEVFRVKLLDSAVLLISESIFCLGFLTSVFIMISVNLSARSTPSMNPDLQLFLGIGGPFILSFLVLGGYYIFLQTLQVLLATAAYLHVRHGVMIKGFDSQDFDHILGLRACSLSKIFGAVSTPGVASEAT